MGTGQNMTKLNRALTLLWIAPFAALGWLGGATVKLYRLAGAAISAGYARGVKHNEPTG